MTNTARTWLAGVLLAATVLLVVARADVHDLAIRSMLAMVVVLCHAWVIAVSERVGADRGGRALTRFPLGPRLLQTRPGVGAQCLLPAVLFGVISMDWRVAALGVVLVSLLMVDLLRAWLPYIIPVALVFIGVSTMEEFHTLGDLVDTAHGWVVDLLWLFVWIALLSGPLLRTDVGGRLTTHGKAVVVLAGLPGYAAGAFVLAHTSLGQQLPDVLGVGFVVLAGGIVQTLVLALFGKAVGLVDRDPADVPDVNARDIGLALIPFALVPASVLGLEWLQMSSRSIALGTPGMWQMLMVLGLVVPAVPAAALVAGALDRVDGRGPGVLRSGVAVGALLVWFVFGPAVTGALFTEGGLIDGLGDWLPAASDSPGVVVGAGQTALVHAGLPGDDLSLWGMPAADMLRACTLMLLAVGAWSARLVRHAPRRLVEAPAAPLLLASLVAGLGAWMLVPQIGPTGAALAVAVAATLAIALDLAAGTKEAPVLEDDAIEALEFSSPLLDELALPEGPAVAVEGAATVASGDDELSFGEWNEAQADEPDELPA